MGKGIVGCNAEKQTSRANCTVRLPAPPYDKAELQSGLKEWVQQKGVRSCFDFGVYNAVLSGQAVRGAGLADNAEFLHLLLNISEHAQINHGDMNMPFKLSIGSSTVSAVPVNP